jgi:PadR family transcriptional regulator, regulatory protein PadR
MATRDGDLVQGSLDMLVLKALIWGPRHGFEVMRWIRQISEGDLHLEEGALYPALHRLAARGWAEAAWGVSEAGRQAKFYTLTETGRRHLEVEASSWRRYVAAVARVLEAT